MIAFCPWEAIQITDVLGYLFPGIKSGPILYNVMGYDIYLVVIVIGAVFSLLIFALNMRGLAAAAVAQKILCLVLVVAAIIGAVAAVIGRKLATSLRCVQSGYLRSQPQGGLPPFYVRRDVCHRHFCSFLPGGL